MRTTVRPPQSRLTQNICSLVIAYTLAVNSPRKARGENAIDFKTMYYMENNDRIKVFSPTVALQHELTPALSIRIDGMYNAISGATPTGAPPAIAPQSQPQRTIIARTPALAEPAATITVPVNDKEDEDRFERSDLRAFSSGKRISKQFNAVSAATPINVPPASTPAATPALPAASSAPSSNQASTANPGAPTQSDAAAVNQRNGVPTAEFSDTRSAGSLELIGKAGRHTPSLLFSYSTESDYDSLGIAVKNATDFNRKNTSLLLGTAFTHDIITPANGLPEDTKDTVDFLAGVTQVLGPKTLWTFNLSRGQVSGFISDPYKVVELNGSLVPEKRPDSKDKTIAYTSLTRSLENLRASVEGSYRYYQDGFGIDAHTFTLAWYQKLGSHFVARPLLRYYTQGEADFYDVRFSGAPEFYSSDYRVSAFEALGYGLKLIWMPTSRLLLDAGYERYDQNGTDGFTPGDVYPSANMFIVGARIWL